MIRPIPFNRIILPIFAVLLLAGAVVASPGIARAADFRSGERVVIGANEVIDDDLFVSAQEVVIDGTVNGDVYALAQDLTINGNVELDVIAAAQTVKVNGKVGDHLRAAGASIVLGENARVGRSALAAGYSVETRQGSEIANDLLFGAYQALLGGTVGKDVLGAANGVELRGTVGRDMRVSVGDSNTNNGFSRQFMMPMQDISVPDVPAGLTIAAGAKISGQLAYESTLPAKLDTGAQVTGPVVQQTPAPVGNAPAVAPTPEQIRAEQTETWVNSLWGQLRRLLVLLAVGLLALWLLPRWIQSLSAYVETKPLGSLGRGVLMVVGLIATLIALFAAMILFAVLFGLLTFGDLAGLSVGAGIVGMSVLSFVYYVFTAYLAPIIVSCAIGHLALRRVQAAWAKNRFVQFLLGLIVLTLIALIPVVNAIVGILVTLFALGALLLWVSHRRMPHPLEVQPTAITSAS